MTKLGEASLTSQGQASIPKIVQEKLHLKKGEDRIVFFEDQKGRVYVEGVETPVQLSAEDWKAFLAKAEKEPVTRYKNKEDALKHLDRLKRK